MEGLENSRKKEKEICRKEVIFLKQKICLKEGGGCKKEEICGKTRMIKRNNNK